MKILLRIILAFISSIILTSLVIFAFAGEKVAAEPKNEPPQVLEYYDYDTLKGAELIRLVQIFLKESGFDPGPIDGVLGPKTREAIKRFQIKKELKPTGEIDEQTFNRIFW
jgi:peptidoglycan hydrolase-like protein with peptidoglycan-binding domain